MSSQIASQSQKPAKKPATYSKHKSKAKEKAASSQPNSQGEQLDGLLAQASSSTIASILHQTQGEISSEEENGDDVNEALAPPGYVRLTDVLDSEEFDWDAVKNNDDLELVILRVPEAMKPRYLSRLSISLPSSQATTTQKLGSLSRKSGSCDVWSLAHPSLTSSAPDVDFDELKGPAVGGEELLGMNVLLPRKKKGGKLYLAPKPITHHLILTAQPALPTPAATPDNSNSTPASQTAGKNADVNADMYKSPARYQHPKHLLKHRFLPTGAGLSSPASSTSLPSTLSTPLGSTGRGRSITSDVARLDEDKPSPSGEVQNEREKDKKDKHGKSKEKQKGHRPQLDASATLEDVASSTTPAPIPRSTKKRKAEGEGKKAKKVKTAGES